MNPNNQKENPAGLKNRNDLLSQDREAQAEQARRAKLAAMTGPELMDHIETLAALLWDERTTTRATTANPNN